MGQFVGLVDAEHAGFEPITHCELTERFRSFDSVEDELSGTRWRWDRAALEWVLDERV